MSPELLEKFTVKLLEKNKVEIDSGATHSIKCQYAQIENIVRDALTEMKESILNDLQSSYDSEMYNGCGDGSLPLVDLESAKCAVDEFLNP
tara:strand:+ start:39164 stop:39436 length:273 start_codon:yes stop_codon:yes gene_type:complete